MLRILETEILAPAMFPTRALPFSLKRNTDLVVGMSVTTTADRIHGVMRIEGDSLVVQWRTARETTSVGMEVRTKKELAPVREVTIPLRAIGSARLRRSAQTLWFGYEVQLTAADLAAFERLTGEGGFEGLVLEHPAQIELQVKRQDRQLAAEFISRLSLALSEHALEAAEQALAAMGEPDDRPLLSTGGAS